MSSWGWSPVDGAGSHVREPWDTARARPVGDGVSGRRNRGGLWLPAPPGAPSLALSIPGGATSALGDPPTRRLHTWINYCPWAPSSPSPNLTASL